jgi:cyclic pyranopterin phosphate synthase
MLIPSLVYSSTDRCDMRCEYCPTEGSGSFGENFEISQHPLTPSEVVWVAAAIGSVGFQTFRLTGGEPLLDIPRVAAILRGVVECGKFSNVRLNTNGSRLAEAIDVLRQIPLTAVKVSLDTLDSSLFEKITKSSGVDPKAETRSQPSFCCSLTFDCTANGSCRKMRPGW